MCQNAFAAGDRPRGPRWGSLQRSPDPLAGFLGRGIERGRDRKGTGEERKDRAIEMEKGRGMEFRGSFRHWLGL